MSQIVSVIIPTRGRPAKLRNCLTALARQVLPSRVEMEIIVAVDGGWNARGAPSDLAKIDPRVRFIDLPPAGASAARNAALALAVGRLVIFSNDDTYPESNWVAEHIAAQQARGTPGMVIGETRWLDWPDMTVFDALLRDTSMVFFYDRMQNGRSHGFRHFWTCNASVPREMVLAAGGFEERLRPVFYEDCELAFRIERKLGSNVYYHQAALNLHDHRMSWSDYARREEMLGRMAFVLSQVNPDCFEAIFATRDAKALAAQYETWLRLDHADHDALQRMMTGICDRPCANVESWDVLRESLYRAHLPLKRRLFREAFVAEFNHSTSGAGPRTRVDRMPIVG